MSGVNLNRAGSVIASEARHGVLLLLGCLLTIAMWIPLLLLAFPIALYVWIFPFSAPGLINILSVPIYMLIYFTVVGLTQGASKRWNCNQNIALLIICVVWRVMFANQEVVQFFAEELLPDFLNPVSMLLLLALEAAVSFVFIAALYAVYRIGTFGYHQISKLFYFAFNIEIR